MIKPYILSAVILFCAVLIETAILSNIAILPSVPDLLLLCTLYFALQGGKLSGEINGFISGIFLDFLSGVPFGFNCLYRTLIGYIAGIIGTTFNFYGFFIPALFGLFATVTKSLFMWIISISFPSVSTVYHIATVPFFFELACNALLAPLVFKLLSIFKAQLVPAQKEV